MRRSSAGVTETRDRQWRNLCPTARAARWRTIIVRYESWRSPPKSRRQPPSGAQCLRAHYTLTRGRDTQCPWVQLRFDRRSIPFRLQFDRATTIRRPISYYRRPTIGGGATYGRPTATAPTCRQGGKQYQMPPFRRLSGMMPASTEKYRHI